MERLFVNSDKQLMIKALLENKVILCNSDTVPALICNIKDEKSIKKIIKIKKRSEEKRFAIMCSDFKMIEEYVNLNQIQIDLIKDILPGYFTIITNLKNITLNKYLSKKNKIGIRISKSEFLNEIIQEIKMPIVATSANISNMNIAESLESVDNEIKNSVDLIINNKENLIGKSSTILDISEIPWQILREGSGFINQKIEKYL